MGNAVRTESVRQALAPMLGERLVSQTQLCDHAAEMLRRYASGRTTLEELQDHVRDVIFGDLFMLLGQRMLLTRENGVIIRIRLEDVDTLADEAVGVLLDVLQPPDLTLDILREFAMRGGSLSAVRVMLQRYGRLLTEAEREMLTRIVRENYPPDRYRHWLQV